MPKILHNIKLKKYRVRIQLHEPNLTRKENFGYVDVVSESVIGVGTTAKQELMRRFPDLRKENIHIQSVEILTT